MKRKIIYSLILVLAIFIGWFAYYYVTETPCKRINKFLDINEECVD